MLSRDDHPSGAPTDKRAASLPARWPFLCLVVLLLPLKILFALRYRVDSDEPQHLHVVWGWCSGRLPYRDFFDNHTPLFHILCAPALKLFGERPESFLWMRLLMAPLYLAALWCAFRIARRLFSERDAIWATLATAVLPPFFFCSTEFRSDDLWMALWLGFIAVMVCGRLSPRHGLLAGLLLGAAMGASMKTALLIVSLGIALGIVVTGIGVRGFATPRVMLRKFAAYAGCILLGFLVVPAAIVLFFYAKGEARDLYNATIGFNVMPGLGRWRHASAWIQWLLFAGILAPGWLIAQLARRSAPTPEAGIKRAIVFLTGTVCFAILRCFWPLLDREHDLPIYPMLLAIAVPVFLESARRFPRLRWRVGSVGEALVALVIVAEIAKIMSLSLSNRTLPETQLLAEVLRLTNPNDCVVDLKGETVFRPRSLWHVYEGITLARFKAKEIKDDLPERVLATRACVAVLDNYRFQERGRAFLDRNFIRVGRMRVAGHTLSGHPDGTWTFQAEIPASYSLVSEHGPVTGMLDGKAYAGPRFLEAGPHRFEPASALASVAAVWSQAVERGFSPYGGPPPG